jgi:dihydroflavonol-4-reductase
VHTASPFHFRSSSLEDLLNVAVNGTLFALKAAHKNKVKRCVVTSSIAAIAFGHDTPKEKYDETIWSNIENLRAKGLDFMGGYMLSKALAEKAAWDYQASLPESERFELVTILPSLVVGEAFVDSGF